MNASMALTDVQLSIHSALRQEFPFLLDSFQTMLDNELGKHFGALLSRIKTECSSSAPADVSFRQAGNPREGTAKRASGTMGRAAKPVNDSLGLAAVLGHNACSMMHELGQSQSDAQLTHGDVSNAPTPMSDLGDFVTDRMQREGDANVFQATQGQNLAISVPTSNVEQDKVESKTQALFVKLEARMATLEQCIRSSTKPHTTDEEYFFGGLGFEPKSSMVPGDGHATPLGPPPDIQNLFPGPLPQNADLFKMVTRKAKTPSSSEAQEEVLSKEQSLEIKVFEGGSTAITLFSAAFTGYVEDAKLQAAIAGDDAPSWIWSMHLVFAILVSLELGARLALTYHLTLPKANKWWIAFDAIIVLASWLELTVVGTGAVLLRLLRILRSTRVFLLLSRVHRLRYVRVMVEVLKGSLLTFIMSLVFYALCTYMVCIVIVQGVTRHINDNGNLQGDSAWRQTVDKYCSSLTDLMASLVCALVGGIDLVELVDALAVMDVAYAVVLIMYVPGLVFGFMNIITGVFVLASNETAQNDFKSEMTAQFLQRGSKAHLLESLLRDGADDESHRVTQQNLVDALQNPSVTSCLQSLDIDERDLLGVHTLLDIHHDGRVDVDDLVSVVLRLQGSPQTADLLTLVHGQDRLKARIDEFMDAVAKALDILSTQRQSGSMNTSSGL